ncbi:uncharacterized protein BJ212DRAFT_1345268 [Suillus subaureus]|uniref:Uncharacterized protein n=1 Tax=Suillus subaureus TaxID=48587 RepID=A0A9P7EEG3_9AGAM|nr:uncharacterized protein BJ212DRAFT_1345268 [Suillus subaureus]KAG1819293.1 hypothetical protein BJ212DRAFT_1345268 [Suillus subaureus]
MPLNALISLIPAVLGRMWIGPSLRIVTFSGVAWNISTSLICQCWIPNCTSTIVPFRISLACCSCTRWLSW